MKIAFLLIIITFSVFNSSHANVNIDCESQGSNLFQFVNNTREREVLLYNCQIIKVQVNEYFAGLNAYNSSSRILAIQQHLTQYLHSVNSDESWKLLREMQANNFSDWTR